MWRRCRFCSNRLRKGNEFIEPRWLRQLLARRWVKSSGIMFGLWIDDTVGTSKVVSLLSCLGRDLIEAIILGGLVKPTIICFAKLA